jgi:Domain of unknown function (DUF1877)
MGITLEFKQVSPYLLNKLKDYPDFTGLFLDAKYLPDSPFWEEFKPFDADDTEWFDEATNYYIETLEQLIRDKPQEFEKIKEELHLIESEGKGVYLDINKTWKFMHFLLTGYEYDIDFEIPFLIGNNLNDGLPIINAILGGKSLEYYENDFGIIYFTNKEVQEISQALSEFSHTYMRERLRFNGLEEENYSYFLNDTYDKLLKYYQDAAQKGNAMVLEFG